MGRGNKKYWFYYQNPFQTKIVMVPKNETKKRGKGKACKRNWNVEQIHKVTYTLCVKSWLLNSIPQNCEQPSCIRYDCD